MTKKLPVVSVHPPVIHRSIVTGKRYAVGGGEWLEIPEHVTKATLNKWMIWRQDLPKPKRPKPQTWIHAGSGNRKYVVSFTEERWHCECQGFRYRSDCKHVESQKKEFQIKD